MMDKTCTLAQAIAAIAPGSTLAIGGLMLHRRPMAAVRELIRARVGDLTLLGATLGLDADLIVGAGLARRVRTCYFGLEAFGLAPMFTRAASDGTLEIIEETETSLACGLRATLARVGFVASPAWMGTDFLRARPDVRTVADPYTGETCVAFPAIAPDAALIHAIEADPMGNAILGGNLAVDWELSLTARTVVVTAERVVPRLSAEADLLGRRVTHVVEAPRGAAPTSCYPLYPMDAEAILAYVEACQSDRFQEYLSAWLES